jgi:hypothetical protein
VLLLEDELYRCVVLGRYVHSVGDLAFDGIWRERGLGVCVVDFVAVRCEEASSIHVRDEGEDIVGWNGEEWVVERAGRHDCGCELV